MVKEVEDRVKNNHWELIQRDKIPTGTKVLDSAWSMKRKRDIMTRKVFKCKPHLNVNVCHHDFDINYFQTHSSVLN